MAIEVTIFCDECSRIGAAAATNGGVMRAHRVRADLAGAGWLCGLPGGMDLCPDCQTPDRVREARKAQPKGER